MSSSSLQIAVIAGPDVVYTPLVAEEPAKEIGNIFIDSGTVLNRLPQELYEEVEAGLGAALDLLITRTFGPLPIAAISAVSEPPPTHHLRLYRSAPSPSSAVRLSSSGLDSGVGLFWASVSLKRQSSLWFWLRRGFIPAWCGFILAWAFRGSGSPTTFCFFVVSASFSAWVYSGPDFKIEILRSSFVMGSGINSDEEFGSWMIAKRNSRKRIHIVEPERKVGKMPENNKSNGKGKKYALGSSFDVLQDVEDRIYSKGMDRLKKTEVATTTWRRKEGEALSSIKEGVVESSEREKSGIGSLKLGKSLIESSESGTKEDVVGHIEKEKLNLDTDGKCSLVIGEPHLESSTVRKKKENVKKVKEKEVKVTNALVGQPVILSQSSDGYNLRPNGLSSVCNKKKAARAHNVIFGSTKTIEISKVSEAKEQARGEIRFMKRRI
ncbi:hypothetical protein K1719_001334 [Acacia pycnantha]|nr:hypothetical protein K1719_001334 [Acacia pycnantha]